MRKSILLFTCLFYLVACTGKKEKMLCKRWQITDVQFIHGKQDKHESDIKNDSVQQVGQQILRNILMKNIYEFHADGTYMTGNEAASSSGKWELEGNSINFILDNDKERKQKKIPFEKLENDTLILLMKNDQTSFQMKLVMIPMPE